MGSVAGTGRGTLIRDLAVAHRSLTPIPSCAVKLLGQRLAPSSFPCRARTGRLIVVPHEFSGQQEGKVNR